MIKKKAVLRVLKSGVLGFLGNRVSVKGWTVCKQIETNIKNFLMLNTP